MLTSLSVIFSLLSLIAVSLPVGYLIVNTFLNRRDLKLPFAPLIPLYLSIGICAQMLISFLVGTALISPFIPNLAAVFSFIIILFQYFKSNRVTSFSFKLRSYTSIFTLILLITIFSYFGRVAVEMQWPPIGDAITHSAFTSLIIHKGHIATDLEPLTNPELSRLFTYPQGFHVLAADLSLRLELNPGEAVFLLAIYIVSLISASLFSLVYVLTRSFLISLTPVFSILFIGPGNLETWIVGYVWNGPYVQLFAFLAIISLIVTLQMWYSKKQSFLSISPVVIITLLALFVTYPSFIYHAILAIGVYFIIHNLRNRNFPTLFKQTTIFKTFENRTRVLTSKLRPLKHFINRTEQPHLNLSDNLVMELQNHRTINMNGRTQENTTAHAPLITTYFPIIVTAAILIIFLAIIVATDLAEFYYRLVSWNIDAFEGKTGQKTYNINLILSEYLSKTSFAIFTFVSIVSSIIFMVIKSKPIPLIIFLYGLIISFLAGINFIYPARTFPFVITLFVPVMAYIVHEVAAGARAMWIDARSRRNASIIYYAIVLTFVLVSLSIQAPSVYNQLTDNPGWFLSAGAVFDDIFKTSTWIKNNVDHDDLILNDRTYSSLYIHGFAIKNLTYSYLTATHPLSTLEQEKMFRELSLIWSDPYYISKIHSLLQKYDVKYIVVSPEGGYRDYRNWGGLEQPIVYKPFSSTEYARIFDSYPFLKLEYTSGEAFVFSVNSVFRNQNYR